MGQPALRDDIPLVQHEPGDELIVLLKKDPITNYSWWKRWLLVGIYWLTNYDGGIELVAICTSEAEADKLAKHAGYRGIWLFVNKPLPDEPCQWKPAIHFKSPFRSFYSRYVPDLVTVKRSDLEKLGMKVEDVFQSAKSA